MVLLSCSDTSDRCKWPLALTLTFVVVMGATVVILLLIRRGNSAGETDNGVVVVVAVVVAVVGCDCSWFHQHCLYKSCACEGRRGFLLFEEGFRHHVKCDETARQIW